MANQTTGNTPRGTSNRGFASMDPETQRKIAQKGGEAVSRDREHMSMIGRKGGEASGGNRNQNTQNAQNTQTTQFGGNEGGGGNR
jgi:general stress protein YciG